MRKLVYIVFIVTILIGLFVPVSAVEATDLDFTTSDSDGYLEETGSAYVTVRLGTNADTVSDSAVTMRIGQRYWISTYYIWRAAVYFDTSSIPDGVTITAATLKLYGQLDGSGADFDITVQNGMPTYPHDPLTSGDYYISNYSGDGGSVNTSTFTTSGYNSITLNSTGMSWINKSGYTKFILRSSEDIGASPPTSYEYVDVYTYEQGAGYRPELEVTYTVDNPDITTNAASNVTYSTARLNSTVVDDGGESCQVRWGYGETSESAIEDYDTYTSYAGSYTTGEHPYLDISSLNSTTQYYFRVEIYNSANTELGSELDFTTESSVGDPSNLRASPSSTSVVLSWTKGSGSTDSVIRYRTDTYPSSYSDGNAVYDGSASTTTHVGLSPGTDYYYAVWAKSGAEYSSGSAQVMATTTAPTGAGGDDLETPDEPSRWVGGTDYTNLSNIPLFYDGVNATADSLSMPRNTLWVIIAVSIAVIAAIAVYKVSNSAEASLITLAAFMWLGYSMEILPWWLPVIPTAIAIAKFFVARREVA